MSESGCKYLRGSIEAPSSDEIHIESHCRLIAFFSLNSDEQRALIPEATEPIYASLSLA